MSGQGSNKLLAKRESMSLAEVDLINSNQFKHDQQRLQRHQAKIRKDYIETMLIHNREYSELKQFLHCIKQVSKEDDDASVKSWHQTVDENSKEKKGKNKRHCKGVNGEDDTDNDESDDDTDEENDTSENKVQTEKADIKSKGSEPPKQRIYLTRPNGLMRVNITPKSTDDDPNDRERTKVPSRLTSRERMDNSPSISESTLKMTARLTALNLNAMRDQFQRISSPLPPNNEQTGGKLKVSSSCGQRNPGHNTLLPGRGDRMGASSPFHSSATGDRPSSRKEASTSPATRNLFSLSAPRRPSVSKPYSSFFPRPDSGMSDDDDVGPAPVSSSFPGARSPSQSREAGAGIRGEGSVSSTRSACKRAPVPPRVGTKALQVLVASQKKILERRKSGEILSTRLMTPSECIEMQNRRRALMRISEENKNNPPPNTPRIGPKRLSCSDKSKSF